MPGRRRDRCDAGLLSARPVLSHSAAHDTVFVSPCGLQPGPVNDGCHLTWQGGPGDAMPGGSMSLAFILLCSVHGLPVLGGSQPAHCLPPPVQLLSPL
jgi:hypothetical protein